LPIRSTGSRFHLTHRLIVWTSNLNMLATSLVVKNRSSPSLMAVKYTANENGPGASVDARPG
jgi:hypothetical protein